MPGLLPDIDPDGLLEFSVVYTDRALNHMSKRFTGVMQDILATLKEVYHAHTAVLVPGSGTFGMEAVARQFANQQKVLIVRNGWFSFRWSQIFDADTGLGGGAVVCKARKQGDGAQAPWAPCPAEEVAAAIRAEQPKVVFAPHVETASGIILSDDYIRTVSAAAHEVGALFVLDCIASIPGYTLGRIWNDGCFMASCAEELWGHDKLARSYLPITTHLRGVPHARPSARHRSRRLARILGGLHRPCAPRCATSPARTGRCGSS